MPFYELYIHSFDVTYVTDPDAEVNKLAVIFPDNVTVPANSVVNIDMKLRINLFYPNQSRFTCGPTVVPNTDIINTSLIYLLPGMPIDDGDYASDLYIPVRNLSGTDYNIVAGTSLFNLVAGGLQLMRIKQVADDHMTMEIPPVE